MSTVDEEREDPRVHKISISAALLWKTFHLSLLTTEGLIDDELIDFY